MALHTSKISVTMAPSIIPKVAPNCSLAALPQVLQSSLAKSWICPCTRDSRVEGLNLVVGSQALSPTLQLSTDTLRLDSVSLDSRREAYRSIRRAPVLCQVIGENMEYCRSDNDEPRLGHDLDYLIVHDNISVRTQFGDDEPDTNSEYKFLMQKVTNNGEDLAADRSRRTCNRAQNKIGF